MPKFSLALPVVVSYFACLSFACLSFATEPPITSVTFSPDGQSVVACSQAGVAVYSWPELKRETRLETSSPNIHDCVFSPSGDRLAVAGGTPAEDGTVELFSWPNGQSLRVLNGHFDSVMAVRWLDETTLASAGLDHNVLIWNVQKGKISRKLKGHARGVLALEFLGGQNILVSAGIDQSLRVWKTDTGDLVRSMAIHIKPVSSVSLRPANEGLPMIASASDDRTVRFWQPTIGRRCFARLPSQPREINWLPDGSQIVACCNDGHLYVINPDTVAITADIHATDDWAYAIAVHPKDGTIAVAGSDGAIKRIVTEFSGLATTPN